MRGFVGIIWKNNFGRVSQFVPIDSWVLAAIVFWGGCGTAIYLSFKKANSHKQHKVINPIFRSKMDTIEYRDSSYIFYRQLDTVFKTEEEPDHSSENNPENE